MFDICTRKFQMSRNEQTPVLLEPIQVFFNANVIIETGKSPDGLIISRVIDLVDGGLIAARRNPEGPAGKPTSVGDMMSYS